MPEHGGTELSNTLNPELLIDAVLRETMSLVAQLATTGGTRVPLGRVTDRIFADLTRALQHRGVTTKVIADMFGMAPRTYHRRVHETRQPPPAAERMVWRDVLELLRTAGTSSGHTVHQNFRHVSAELVSGALNDLVHSGLALRNGWGETAVYRITLKAEGVLRQGPSELNEAELRILEGHRALLVGLLAELELALGSDLERGEPVRHIDVTAQAG